MPPKPKPARGTTGTGGFSARDLREMEKALAAARRMGLLPPGLLPANPKELKKLLKDIEKHTRTTGVDQPADARSYIPFKLPASRKAVLLSAFFDESADPAPQLTKMLKARGYQVIRKELTLAALRTLPEEGPIGILYLASHALSDQEGIDTGFDIGTMISAEETFAETKQREKDQRKKLVGEKTLNTVIGRNERGGHKHCWPGGQLLCEH